MSTTLHAMVQSFSPKSEHTIDYWSNIAEWEFGKNYELMRWMHENAHQGWPDDVGSHNDKSYEFCGDSHGERYWCTLTKLESALKDLQENANLPESDDRHAPAWVTVHLEAMVASVQILDDHDVQVRVLFYEM